ncbi:MAG TPA: thiamine-phosphate kinase [Alphaproteobacteria bacterium]|nr:thiamine-phosphate kinase [Alphaproteobacteria bacterium]
MRPKTRPIGEFALIARYFAPLSREVPGAYSLTDDAAWVRAEPGLDWVVTSDAIVSGVHFLPDDPPDLVARKALRVNLSDLAAKGAAARFYLLDAVLPQDIEEAWIAGFASGLAADQAEYGVRLIGGDTTTTPGTLTLAITALGQVGTGRMLTRGGAREGDDVYVSGTIGDAAIGLISLRGGLGRLSAAASGWLADRYRLPQPRTLLGPALLDLAQAAMDVSDGLVADLGHICETSGLGAVIDEPSVPLSAAAREAVQTHPALIESVLAGGDDYEILFTADPSRRVAVAELARRLELPITRIGAMRSGSGVAVIRADGSERALDSAGWQHF